MIQALCIMKYTVQITVPLLRHVHTLRVARTHIFLTHFLCVAYTLSFSILIVSSTVFAVRSLRHFVLVCTFLAELLPIRKCGSSALPHERRGVWLPGRFDALHTSSTTRWSVGARGGRDSISKLIRGHSQQARTSEVHVIKQTKSYLRTK